MPNLFIDIEARFAKFQDSLDQIQRRADGFAKGLTRSFGTLGTVLGGLGVALGGAGIANALRETINAADDLDKVSQKTGVTTEALSELRFAAEINNVTFDQLQDGFKKLAVAIDANDDVFRRLDLDPKQFNGLDDALGAVADRFAQIKDPVAAAALAVDLFGKSGNDLLPLLRLGRAGIQEFREEARRLGLTITGDFAKNADAFNDELERMQSAFRGVGISLASGVLPTLTKFLEDINRGTQLAGGFFDALRSLGTINPFKSIDSNVAGYRKSIEEARKDIERLRADLARPGVVGTPKLAIQSQISSLESGIKRDTTRLKFLQNQQAEDAVAKFSGDQFKDARDLGANDKTFTPGAKKPDKTTSSNSASESGFVSLKKSLLSQLNAERKLTQEQILLEDERYKKATAGEQSFARAIALTLDSINQQKTNRVSIDSATSAEASIREESLRTELDAIERRKLVLSQSYEDSKLSAQAYYTAVARAETEATLLRIANLRQIADAQEEIVEDPDRSNDEQLNAKVKLASIQREIIELTREQADISTRTSRAIRQADEETLRRKVEISQQVNQTLGIRNPELDRAALLNQFRDVPEEFKQTVTFKAFIDTKLAEQQLSEFERDAGTIEQTLRIKEERITQDVSRGSTSEFAAERLVSEERSKAASELETIVQRVEDVRAANVGAFGPAQDARLEALRNRLRELNAAAEDHANALRDIGQDAFADFFGDVVRGGEDAIGVFDRLGEAIERNLTNRIGQGLSDQLFAEIGSALPSGEGSGLSGALSSGAGAIGDFLGFKPNKKQAAGLGESETTDAINASADAGAAEFGNLSNSVLDSQIAVDGLTAALTGATPDVESSLVDFGTSAITAQLGAQSLGTVLPTATAGAGALVIANESVAVSTTSLSLALQLAAAAANEAAIQFAIAGATASAGGGGFADGGVFSGGVQAFATGGIVGSPTTFPMAGGKIGLMGEAGPEAIMPLSRVGGRFGVYAMREDGTEDILPVARNGAGKLAVRMPSQSSPKPFALGGVFDGGGESYTFTSVSDSSSTFRDSLTQTDSVWTTLSSAIVNASDSQSILRDSSSSSENVFQSLASVSSESVERDLERMAVISAQPFADGGVVNASTLFPMQAGKIGLMGEAGPEAIMPLARDGGGFSVHAIRADGSPDMLQIGRNGAGRLSVRLPADSPIKAYADGGVFSGGLETYAMRFADGAVLSAAAQRFSTLPFRAYANGGIARTPQIGLFGERPEAFVPLPDGKSIPVTMDAMQSSGITLVQNITTPDANSFRRSRASIYNEANAGLSAASSRA